jgi:hypothetical protein
MKTILKQTPKPEFQDLIGNVAVLRDGSSVKILGEYNQKLFVKALDGSLKECYHSDLQYVMEE